MSGSTQRAGGHGVQTWERPGPPRARALRRSPIGCRQRHILSDKRVLQRLDALRERPRGANFPRQRQLSALCADAQCLGGLLRLVALLHDGAQLAAQAGNVRLHVTHRPVIVGGRLTCPGGEGSADETDVDDEDHARVSSLSTSPCARHRGAPLVRRPPPPAVGRLCSPESEEKRATEREWAARWTLAMRKLTFAAAPGWRGLRTSSGMSILAPCLMSRHESRTCPFRAARCKGVSPSCGGEREGHERHTTK